MGEGNSELWVQFVREIAAGVVAIIGALAAYRWGEKRRAQNGVQECADCKRRINVELGQERTADAQDALHRERERKAKGGK